MTFWVANNYEKFVSKIPCRYFKNLIEMNFDNSCKTIRLKQFSKENQCDFRNPFDLQCSSSEMKRTYTQNRIILTSYIIQHCTRMSYQWYTTSYKIIPTIQYHTTIQHHTNNISTSYQQYNIICMYDHTNNTTSYISTNIRSPYTIPTIQHHTSYQQLTTPYSVWCMAYTMMYGIHYTQQYNTIHHSNNTTSYIIPTIQHHNIIPTIQHHTSFQQYNIIHHTNNTTSYIIPTIQHHTSYQQYNIIHHTNNTTSYIIPAIQHHTSVTNNTTSLHHSSNRLGDWKLVLGYGALR